ncbi:hypothetical protein [Alkalihalobacillus sp. AL-G]|uniref:hypothetical protein n=1 Tax=Alkalihalobacillus sp. AL-G TaxID=2926399 RepID=UPI00272B5921|nr:hypothetical protein [Alkalihalobacillus sp. AL-G]WLD94895.1 hypothetical protein MOJ78_08435 [Alkalihalobacillus sp. AL-G]
MSYRKYMQAYNAHTQQLRKHCKKHLHKHVKCHMIDGQVYEGYLEHVDKKNVYLIVEIESKHQPKQSPYEEPTVSGQPYTMPQSMNQNRQFPSYPYPRFTYRRLILPQAYLTALSPVPY